MHKAEHETETFKEELDNLRHIMNCYLNNITYIRLYKGKEQQMLGEAMVLARKFCNDKLSK